MDNERRREIREAIEGSWLNRAEAQAYKKGASMDSYNAVGIAEGFVEADSEEQVVEAWQYLVDSGMAWSLQGWFGRQAQAMIESGVIHAKGA